MVLNYYFSTRGFWGVVKYGARKLFFPSCIDKTSWIPVFTSSPTFSIAWILTTSTILSFVSQYVAKPNQYSYLRIEQFMRSLSGTMCHTNPISNALTHFNSFQECCLLVPGSLSLCAMPFQRQKEWKEELWEDYRRPPCPNWKSVLSYRNPHGINFV